MYVLGTDTGLILGIQKYNNENTGIVFEEWEFIR